jgi:hypothetical protein
MKILLRGGDGMRDNTKKTVKTQNNDSNVLQSKKHNFHLSTPSMHSQVMQLQRQVGNQALIKYMRNNNNNVVQRAATVEDIDSTLIKQTDGVDGMGGYSKKSLSVAELKSFNDKHVRDNLDDETAINAYIARYEKDNTISTNTIINSGDYGTGKAIEGKYFVRNNANADTSVQVADVNAKSATWIGGDSEDVEDPDNYEINDLTDFDLSGNLKKNGVITINHYGL